VVIAIDGPGGVGKSTIARTLANRLGKYHLDTGATYRAATLAVVSSGTDPNDLAATLLIVKRSNIDYKDGIVLLDGVDVTEEVRGERIDAAVSAVAAHRDVRSTVVALQREWVSARDGEVVVEGRDIGTVVFPKAAVKIYVTARPEVRAARRIAELAGPHKDAEVIAQALARRDLVDATRKVSPLRPARDAAVIDTSDLSIEEVVQLVMEQIDSAD